MRRIELLFGEMGSRETDSMSGHTRPDPTLPLRMQAQGRGRRMPARARWRVLLWRRALRSGTCWRRAVFLGALAAAATALCAEQVWTTVAVGGLVMLVALISGVWARLDVLAQRAESQRN
jgi:hypothetical protein